MSSRVIAWIAGRGQSGQLRGAANVTLIVCAYILAYSTLDRLSLLQEIPSVRFTLWNPPPACSLVLLLTKGLRYAPALFVAGGLTDRLIDGFPLGLGATFVTEFVITLGYFVIAASLRRASCDGRNFDGVGAVILLLGILGVGVFGIAGLVGMILVAMRELPSDQLFATGTALLDWRLHRPRGTSSGPDDGPGGLEAMEGPAIEIPTSGSGRIRRWPHPGVMDDLRRRDG